MPADVQTSGWSGDGDFTRVLIDVLREVPGIAAVRVEDTPASRSEGNYLLLSNECYLRFERPVRRLRWSWRRPFDLRGAPVGGCSLATVESVLAAHDAVGPPDYSDDSMLQYLRTERIIPPYQTRGYKLVELVRIYAVE